MTDFLAHLNKHDLQRLDLLVRMIAQKDSTTSIPGLLFDRRNEVFRYIRLVEEELEVMFVNPPSDYLKSARGFVDPDGMIVNLLIPAWDEVSQSDYSIVVDIHLDTTPHLIEFCDFHIL